MILLFIVCMSRTYGCELSSFSSLLRIVLRDYLLPNYHVREETIVHPDNFSFSFPFVQMLDRIFGGGNKSELAQAGAGM